MADALKEIWVHPDRDLPLPYNAKEDDTEYLDMGYSRYTLADPAEARIAELTTRRDGLAVVAKQMLLAHELVADQYLPDSKSAPEAIRDWSAALKAAEASNTERGE